MGKEEDVMQKRLSWYLLFSYFLSASYTECASLEFKLTKTLFYRHFKLIDAKY